MTILSKAAFVKQIESLPPLPSIAHRVLEVTGSPASSAQDLANVLRGDPIIAAKILRVANSPFYRANQRITQLTRAVTRLGITAIRNLVLGICAQKTLTQNTFQRVEHEALWYHAIAVAAACELIARRIRFDPAEEAFVGGLLHDTGHLAMLMLQPDRFRSILYKDAVTTSYLGLERDQFGIDHAEAGFLILSRWGLPESLCQLGQRHHIPETDLAGNGDPLLAIVVLGNILAHVAGFSLDRPVGPLTRSAIVAQQLNLSDADQAKVFNNLEQRVTEAIDMLGDMNIVRPVPRLPECLPEVAWMRPDGSDPPGLQKALLEQRGYVVRCVPASGVTGGVPQGGLILVDWAPQDGKGTAALVVDLMRQGHRRIVVLKDLDEGAASRHRDGRTAICRIPRLFTMFDIKWVEEQLRS